MSERTSLLQANADLDEDGRQFDLDAWTDLMTALGHTTDYKRAKALKMSHSTLSRLRSGECGPGPKLIRRTRNLGIPFDAFFPVKAAH